LDSAGDYVEKQSCVKAIHSQCRFCKWKNLYVVKTFVSLFSRHASYFCTVIWLPSTAMLQLLRYILRSSYSTDCPSWINECFRFHNKSDCSIHIFYGSGVTDII
jgi:hypothetical protein